MKDNLHMTNPSIILDPDSGEPLVEQLRRQLLWQIASGQYKTNDRLPSVRNLAQQLSINMHTVRSAYQRLETDGLVRTRQGSGTRVLQLDPNRLVELASQIHSYSIGIILPGMSNPFYHTFLQGVEQIIRRRQMLLFVCDAHEDGNEFARYFAQLATRNVDGIIIASFDLPGYLGSEFSPALPLVTVDCPGCSGPVINFNLEEASRSAVHHLLGHGHQRIGLITFEHENANVAAINAGYINALSETGLKPEDALIARMPDFLPPSGETGVKQLMDQTHPPTAIFTIADTLAFGALRSLRNSGWPVPVQVALVSLNDVPFAQVVDPPLTTVNLPAHRLGLEAARMLLDLIDGKTLLNTQITIPTKLIIRKSCGCID